MNRLKYTPLERLHISKPVLRSEYILSQCHGRNVLDLGCYDETSLIKLDAGEWLHGKISKVAKSVVGIDNSPSLPKHGIITAPNSRIISGDVYELEKVLPPQFAPDIIVAGELIEHLTDPILFLRKIKNQFSDRQLLITTPNATHLSNMVLAFGLRESNHKDHINIFSFKTLNTVCQRAGFCDWEIIPYHVFYTEMTLRTKGIARTVTQLSEWIVSKCEYVFPLLSFGYIVNVRKL